MRRIIVISALLSGCMLYSADAAKINREGVEKANSNDLDSAIEKFDEAINVTETSSAKVYNNLGYASEMKGDDEAAVKYYEQALERNPDLVASLERVCALYCKAGLYANSIAAGEKTLKLDPKNSYVLPWLEKAYVRRFRVKADELSAEEKNKLIEKTAEESKEKKKTEYKRRFEAGISGLLRYAYFSGGGDSFRYVKTPGIGPLDFPFTLSAKVMPDGKWTGEVSCGVPYYGSLMPRLLYFYERAELSYTKDNVTLGIGFSGYHYNDDGIWGVKEKFNDYKIGLIIVLNNPSSDFSLKFYPALIPYDAGYSPVRTLDVSYVDMRYSVKWKDDYRITARFTSNGFTFYDHGEKTSNYAGNYDLALGVLIPAGSGMLLGAEFCERIYMMDSNNKDPYTFMNGQGFFGFNRKKWFKGDPMSGYYSGGHVISVSMTEKYGVYAEFYQKLSVEIVRRSKEQNDIVVECGVKAGF